MLKETLLYSYYNNITGEKLLMTRGRKIAMENNVHLKFEAAGRRLRVPHASVDAAQKRIIQKEPLLAEGLGQEIGKYAAMKAYAALLQEKEGKFSNAIGKLSREAGAIRKDIRKIEGQIVKTHVAKGAEHLRARYGLLPDYAEHMPKLIESLNAGVFRYEKLILALEEASANVGAEDAENLRTLSKLCEFEAKEIRIGAGGAQERMGKMDEAAKIWLEATGRFESVASVKNEKFPHLSGMFAHLGRKKSLGDAALFSDAADEKHLGAWNAMLIAIDGTMRLFIDEWQQKKQGRANSDEAEKFNDFVSSRKKLAKNGKIGKYVSEWVETRITSENLLRAIVKMENEIYSQLAYVTKFGTLAGAEIEDAKKEHEALSLRLASEREKLSAIESGLAAISGARVRIYGGNNIKGLVNEIADGVRAMKKGAENGRRMKVIFSYSACDAMETWSQSAADGADEAAREVFRGKMKKAFNASGRQIFRYNFDGGLSFALIGNQNGSIEPLVIWKAFEGKGEADAWFKQMGGKNDVKLKVDINQFGDMAEINV